MIASGRRSPIHAWSVPERPLRAPARHGNILPGSCTLPNGVASHPRRRSVLIDARRRFWAGGVLARQDNGRKATADLLRVRAVAAGDERAFAALVDEHGPALIRFAQSVLGTLPDAEDAVQETLLKLWENAADWRPEARLTTWLHTVCYNGSLDRIRRRRALVGLAEIEDREDEALQPDGELLRGEAVAGVRAAIQSLPHRQRTALILFHFQELSQAEAAAVMALSGHAFESLLARARRTLRARLVAATGENGGDINA